jgi:tight adherence protein C
VTYVIALAIFVAVGLLAWSLLSLFFSEDRAVRRRLDQMSDYEQSEVLSAEPVLRPFSERVIVPAGQAVSRFTTSVTPVGYRDRLKKNLVLAGSPQRMDSGRFLTVKFLGAAAVLLFTVGYSVLRGASVRMWILGLGLAALAFFLPDLWLSSKVRRRQKQIRRELPDMLDMLTISVEAGLGFDQAISKYVRNAEGPLAMEFARMLQEVQSGVDRTTALRNLAARTDVPELNSFITAIMQAETFGISISSVLRTQAAEMRLKRRQLAEESAQKAPVKMVFPLILCILPATLIVVLGLAVVSIGRAFGLLN